MNFYLNEYLLECKKNIKNTFIRLIALSVLTIILNVAFCLLIGKIHYVAVQIINTFLSAVCVCAIIYKVDTVIVIARKKIKHYMEIKVAPKNEICGAITAIGDVITVNTGLKAREIILASERKSYSFYLLEDFEYNFEFGDIVKFTVAKKHITNSFIVEKSEKENHA